MSSFSFYEATKDAQGAALIKNFLPQDDQGLTWDDVGLEKYFDTQVEAVQQLPGSKIKRIIKSIGELIGLYHGHDLHMDSTIPSELEKQLNLPKAIMCGPYKTNLVNKKLWRSSGKFAEKLKMSIFDKIICTLNGRSDWIIFEYVIKDSYKPVYCILIGKMKNVIWEDRNPILKEKEYMI